MSSPLKLSLARMAVHIWMNSVVAFISTGDIAKLHGIRGAVVLIPVVVFDHIGSSFILPVSVATVCLSLVIVVAIIAIISTHVSRPFGQQSYSNLKLNFDNYDRHLALNIFITH